MIALIYRIVKYWLTSCLSCQRGKGDGNVRYGPLKRSLNRKQSDRRTVRSLKGCMLPDTVNLRQCEAPARISYVANCTTWHSISRANSLQSGGETMFCKMFQTLKTIYKLNFYLLSMLQEEHIWLNVSRETVLDKLY